MKRIKISLILNIVNALFVTFAVIAMTSGFHFMSDDTILELASLSAFQFFTFDSNLLLGIVTVMFIAYEIMLIKGKIEKIPRYAYLLKFVSTVAVGLTMFTVVILLAPQTTKGYFSLFLNANLFFHLICPLVAIISFCFFEKQNDIKFKECVYGLIPTLLYGIYYTINVAIYMENGVVAFEHDWYGFAKGGAIGIALSVIMMFSGTYLISLLVYFLNKKVLNETIVKNDE